MTKRSLINVNYVDFIYDYQFINHVHVGGTGISPVAAYWSTSGNPVWNSDVLDANGWPNTSVANGNSFGNHILVPASADYSTYVIKWTGRGRLTLVGTWTETSTSGTGYVRNGNGDWSGKDVTIEATYSGAASPAQLSWRVVNTDPLVVGDYFNDLKIYRKEDETDLLAGKIFRRGYKQTLVDLNPSAIRVMNWTGGNDDNHCRFEDRAVPTYATYGFSNPLISPPYGETSTANQMTLASAAGMPVAMTHGEVVQCRIGTGLLRAAGSGAAAGAVIASISKASPAVVVTTGVHGFNDGDTVVFRVPTGMTEMDYRVGVITLDGVDPTHKFTVPINSTGFGTYVSGGLVNQNVTLNVGSRGAYPVVFTDGTTPASVNGVNYLRAGDTRAFHFDKTMAASKDGSGNLVYGAWLIVAQASNAYIPYEPGVPLEICTALVNEINAMGPQNTVDMWITLPHRALLSMDPDYSAGSNYASGSVDVVMNGANGYAGLSAPATLFVEYSNETWNSGPSFPQASYLTRRGLLRDPVNGGGSSYMTSLRSVVMTRDITASYGASARVKFILAGQGTVGIAAASTNYNRCFGATAFFNDVLISPSVATPISYHDYWAWAAYFLAGPTYDAANLATLAAAWVAADGDAVAQEAVCATYVTDGVVGSGYTEAVARYRDTLLPAYAASMVGVGKQTCMYEGGWDKTVTGGTADVNNFLIAVKKSRAWANATRDFFNEFDATAGADMPADYIQIDQRWGHAYQDQYSGGVEGGGLDLAWQYAGLRNRGKRRLLVKT